MRFDVQQRLQLLMHCSYPGLLVFALSISFSAVAFAQDCLVQVTTDDPLGWQYESQSHTFSELEEITRIVDVDPTGRYRKCSNGGNNCSWEDYECRDSRYTFHDNILSVNNPDNRNRSQCRAIFSVEGVEADCYLGGGGDDGIAQTPLFLSQSAEPNVMYVLDDSGSMHFEIMPGELIKSSAYYLFPREDGVYGGNDYTNYVVTVDSDSVYNAQSRSPQFNSIYYDPGVTYRPWIKADGTYYANASASCAYHNPENTGAGCRDLQAGSSNQNSTRWLTHCDSEGCYYTTNSKTYWPSSYFWFDGGEADPDDRDSFTKVEIKSSTSSYVGEGRENRQDCADSANATCSFSEEAQNFANWYTYYRSRVLAARAGSGFAFAQQGGNIRVGFGALNVSSHSVDSVNTSTIVSGVRQFQGDARTSFFESLYEHTIPNSDTPLRAALNSAGQYFSRDDDRGPWSDTPGEDIDYNDSNEDQLACRRNYTVLVTDGYWSGSDVSGGPGDNNDNTGGPTHSRALGGDYTYEAVSPFADSRSDTLADVAMYYWKNDLRDDLDNLINETPTNPAFWQHMVTYGVGFGVTGTINPDTAFAAIGDTATTITWPDPETNDVHKIDDLLHAGVNSRGGFFSAAEPNVFASELASVLEEISQESKASASSIAVNSTRLDSGSLVYQASFNSSEWSGRLQAYTLAGNGAISTTYWDTNTGGKIPAAASRNIIAGVGDQGAISTTGIALTVANWDSLAASQRSLLRLSGDSVDDAKDRLDWLRGDRTREATDFRSRKKILGDIVNSDPFFVGNSENYGYHLLSGAEGSSYPTYLSSKSARTPMLYVGANDGMLHGFNAATGVETFAYVPVASFPNLASLSEPGYTHKYFVDGAPRALDAYLNNAWKTLLVGAMGAGGRSVFALNVTDPANLGVSSLMWEFATAEDATDKLGAAMSQPAIARLAADGKWVVIFGNGYNSDDNVKLFILDLATGALLKAIDTGVSGDGNGLTSAVPVDINSDRVTDYVYAGDLQGNLWKFDLTGNAQNNWDVALKQGNTPLPIFTAVDADGNPQPITSRPTVGRHPGGGYMVYFGTGKYFENSDAQLPVSPQLQEFYGIRDAGAAVMKANLVSQSVLYEGYQTTTSGDASSVPVRIVSNNSADAAPTYGWRLPLVGPSPATVNGERVVSAPVLRNGRIIFASITPDESICGYGGTSWLMELDALNGGRTADPVLDINNDGHVNYLDLLVVDDINYPANGIGTDEMIKTPGIIGAGELEYKYTSGTSGTIGVITETGGDSDVVGRQSWRQLQ